MPWECKLQPSGFELLSVGCCLVQCCTNTHVALHLTNYLTDDFVTADIYTETGGLDASIGFETTRAENVGPAFNDALLFFSFFYNAQVSSESSGQPW